MSIDNVKPIANGAKMFVSVSTAVFRIVWQRKKVTTASEINPSHHWLFGFKRVAPA